MTIWLSIPFLFCQKLNLLAALPLNSGGQNLIHCFADSPSSFLSSSWENHQAFCFQAYALVAVFPYTED